MAMNVRIPADLDARLGEFAESNHVSKNAIVIRAIEEHLRREDKTARVLASLEETSRDYAGLITRLEDA